MLVFPYIISSKAFRSKHKYLVLAVIYPPPDDNNGIDGVVDKRGKVRNKNDYDYGFQKLFFKAKKFSSEEEIVKWLEEKQYTELLTDFLLTKLSGEADGIVRDNIAICNRRFRRVVKK